MTQLLQEAFAAVQKRPDDEQDLIAAIVMEELASSKIPNSHKEELDRRLAALEANPQAGSSWDDVKVRLKGGA